MGSCIICVWRKEDVERCLHLRVQILPEGVCQRFFPLLEAFLHLAQHALPELDIPGDSAAVELFLPADYILYGIN